MTFRNPNSAEPTDTSPQPEAGTGGTDRMAALAEAFGMDGRVGGALSAQSAAETFSEATLTLARAQPAFVKEVEAVRPTPCLMLSVMLEPFDTWSNKLLRFCVSNAMHVQHCT